MPCAIDDVLNRKHVEYGSIRMDSDLKAMGQQCAARQNLSFSEFMRILVARECANQGLIGATGCDVDDLEIALLRARASVDTSLVLARSLRAGSRNRGVA